MSRLSLPAFLHGAAAATADAALDLVAATVDAEADAAVGSAVTS
jgi:hypothetical protein